MKFPKLTFFLFIVFVCAVAPASYGQDSIPPAQEVDTAFIDTIVIRSVQEKIKIIPRGVNLVNPVVSFSKTKPLLKRFNSFKMPSFWVKENTLGLNLSEVAFVNWNAGGENSVSALGSAKFVRNYKFRYIQWDNDLILRFGLNSQEGRELRKTEDAIRFSSTFGYRRDTLSNWYYSAKVRFNTQFANGFKYPDRSKPISRFMAPGYLFVGAGTSYISETNNFNLYISPLTQKATFVLDQDLANEGAFGVEKAILDASGAIITEGKNRFIELGFLINNSWTTTVSKNVEMEHKISLYTDYLRSFGNIDLDWELNFKFIVNEYINANFGTQIIYDDDILFDRTLADDGSVLNPGRPKLQFRQLLGIGLSYNF